MPRINQPSVPEHRAAQHRAVLDAAERLIVDSDGKVPTIAEVAAEVGLARSSVYLYVASGKYLIIQLLLQAIPAWLDSLTAELDRVGSDPAERLAAYVRVTLKLFVEGSHGPLMSAASTLPETFTDERVQESHNGLDPALRDEYVVVSAPRARDEVETVRPLIDAMIHRGAELINQSQAEFDQIADILQRMARAAVNPPRGARP